MTHGSPYDFEFFRHVDAGGERSAALVVPLMQAVLPVASVLDVGCGRGAWLRTWQSLGVSDVIGVDGSHAATGHPLAAAGAFVCADLTAPLDLGRRFDAAMCLEVAEHILPAASAELLRTLSRHADAVFFSAATPGQGGLHHVNEQPLIYWVEHFRRAGFEAFDPLRLPLQGVTAVDPWYRYNLLFFARGPALARLSSAASASRLAEGVHPRSFESPLWWLRRQVLRCLPRAVIDTLARGRHRAGQGRL